MSDEEATAFARELAAEVEDATRSGAGSVYNEEEFTRLVLDKLAAEGALENPILLWQEGTFSSNKYKITGFSLSDDEDRLLLITTVYTGELPPRRLSVEEILTAFKQALQFYESSRGGLHQKIDPANTDAGDLARRIFELRGQIACSVWFLSQMVSLPMRRSIYGAPPMERGLLSTCSALSSFIEYWVRA